MNKELGLSGIFVALLYCSSRLYGQVLPGNRVAAVDRNRPSVRASASYLPQRVDSLNCKYHFLKGMGSKISGNSEAAVSEFMECLRYDPGNHAAYYELALAYCDNKQLPEALSMVNKAIQINPSQIWYYNLLAIILDKKDDQANLALVFKKMSQIEPKNPNYYLGEANALANLKRFNEAIALIDKAESIGESEGGLGSVSAEELELQKQKIYLKDKQFDKALQSVKRLIKGSPQEAKYYLLAAEIYRDQHQPAKVIENIRMAVHVDSTNGLAQLSLSDCYREQGDKKHAFEALQMAFRSEDIDLGHKKRILFDYYVNVPANDQQEGMELAHLLVGLYPEDKQVQQIYAGFLAINGGPGPDQRNAMLKMLETQKGSFELWTNVILSDLNLRKYADAAMHTEEALIYFPNQITLYIYRGFVLDQLGKSDSAIQVLKDGLVLAVGQSDLEAQIYQELGDVYHRIGAFDLSYAAFDEALKRKPDDANTLNNYSYYLSIRKKDLDRAERMAAQSTMLSPNNPNFEDTYAWILYQQNKIKLALFWIEKALSHSQVNSPVFRDHYGDILFKSGQVDKAVESWKKAKAFGSKDLNLSRKIANKKLYE